MESGSHKPSHQLFFILVFYYYSTTAFPPCLILTLSISFTRSNSSLSTLSVPATLSFLRPPKHTPEKGRFPFPYSFSPSSKPAPFPVKLFPRSRRRRLSPTLVRWQDTNSDSFFLFLSRSSVLEGTKFDQQRHSLRIGSELTDHPLFATSPHSSLFSATTFDVEKQHDLEYKRWSQSRGIEVFPKSMEI